MKTPGSVGAFVGVGAKKIAEALNKIGGEFLGGHILNIEQGGGEAWRRHAGGAGIGNEGAQIGQILFNQLYNAWDG